MVKLFALQTCVFIITEALHIQFTNHHACTFIKNKVDRFNKTKSISFQVPPGICTPLIENHWYRESAGWDFIHTYPNIQHIHTLQMILHNTLANSELVEWWIQYTDNEREEDNLKAIMLWNTSE